MKSHPAWRSGGAAAALGLLLAGCQPQPDAAERTGAELSTPAPAEAGTPVPVGRNFDFYVLALSWSPSYCEAEGEDANRQQCAAGRPHAFVVHGLWPQFERGYPENCATAEPGVDRDKLRGLYDLMPSAGLIRHEWRTHGSCSGLSQDDYFAVLRAARNRIVVPPDLAVHEEDRTIDPDIAERAFVDANDGLSPDGLAVTCDDRFLREVRICLTRELRFRSCPEIDRRACRRDAVVMPPVHGG